MFNGESRRKTPIALWIRYSPSRGELPKSPTFLPSEVKKSVIAVWPARNKGGRTLYRLLPLLQVVLLLLPLQTLQKVGASVTARRETYFPLLSNSLRSGNGMHGNCTLFCAGIRPASALGSVANRSVRLCFGPFLNCTAVLSELLTVKNSCASRAVWMGCQSYYF